MSRPVEVFLRPSHRLRYLIRDVLRGIFSGIAGFHLLFVIGIKPFRLDTGCGTGDDPFGFVILITFFLFGRLVISQFYQGWERLRITALAKHEALPADLVPLILPNALPAYLARFPPAPAPPAPHHQ
jgi:hypothetical protein